MPLLLTQRARKERVRYVADILKEPSSNRGECPHTIYSSVELLQYDRKNENDGRRFKYCNEPGCARVQYTSEPLSSAKANLLQEYQNALDQLYHTSKMIGEMEIEARRLSKSPRSLTTPRRQRAPSGRFLQGIPSVVQDGLAISSRIRSSRRPNRMSYMRNGVFSLHNDPPAPPPRVHPPSLNSYATRETVTERTRISPSSNGGNPIDLTGDDPAVSADSEAYFHGEQPAQDRLSAMNVMYNGWRY